MRLLATAACLMLCIPLVSSVKAHDDLAFYPPVLDVTRDSSGFVQQLIHFASVSGDSVRITRVEGSCRCATGSVQRSLAYDTVQGKMYLGINAQHFVDSLNYVDYTIHHTGSHSPQMFRVIVHLPVKQ